MSELLTVSVALFIFGGAFHILIGTVSLYFIRNPPHVPRYLVINAVADAAIFGRKGEELVADVQMRKLQEIMIGWVGGLLVGVGVLEVSLAWFGLAAGQAWALGALAVTSLLMVVFWVDGYRLWMRAGRPGGFFGLPPFQWLPATLSVPAFLLGWLGLLA